MRARRRGTSPHTIQAGAALPSHDTLLMPVRVRGRRCSEAWPWWSLRCPVSVRPVRILSPFQRRCGKRSEHANPRPWAPRASTSEPRRPGVRAPRRPNTRGPVQSWVDAAPRGRSGVGTRPSRPPVRSARRSCANQAGNTFEETPSALPPAVLGVPGRSMGSAFDRRLPGHLPRTPFRHGPA